MATDETINYKQLTARRFRNRSWEPNLIMICLWLDPETYISAGWQRWLRYILTCMDVNIIIKKLCVEGATTPANTLVLNCTHRPKVITRESLACFNFDQWKVMPLLTLFQHAICFINCLSVPWALDCLTFMQWWSNCNCVSLVHWLFQFGGHFAP